MNLSKKLSSNSIDLVVTSPPYADIRSYGKDVNLFHPDNYVDWILPLYKEAARFLKSSGSFVIVINDKVIDGCRHPYVFDMVCRVINETGLKLYDRYVWIKKGGLPTGTGDRFNDWMEYIFHFVKDPKEFKRDTKQVRYKYTDEEIISGGYSYDLEVKTKVVDSDGILQRRKKPRKFIPINPDGKKPMTWMRFNRACMLKTSKYDHPAPFTEEIPEFFIRWLTEKGDLVMDPFLGSGTTAYVAKLMEREYIGFELNSTYKDFIDERLDWATLPL